jgi:hypothetical protein
VLSRTTTQFRRGRGPRHQRWLAIPFAVALFGGVLIAPAIAAAAGSGSISGTVTALAGGAPLGGVCVEVGLSDDVFSATTTDGNGLDDLGNRHRRRRECATRWRLCLGLQRHRP